MLIGFVIVSLWCSILTGLGCFLTVGFVSTPRRCCERPWDCPVGFPLLDLSQYLSSAVVGATPRSAHAVYILASGGVLTTLLLWLSP